MMISLLSYSLRLEYSKPIKDAPTGVSSLVKMRHPGSS